MSTQNMFLLKVWEKYPRIIILYSSLTISVSLLCLSKKLNRSILTHCRLNRLSHTIYWKSSVSILGTAGYEVYIFLKKKAKLFANSGDPDQTPHSAASDLGLHCLPVTLLRVSRLQWLNIWWWHLKNCLMCVKQCDQMLCSLFAQVCLYQYLGLLR